MAFAITQNCCKEASCVAACPVNCIHPAPNEPGFASAAMLYVDARACIDCGACADACPVDAAVSDDVLAGPDRAYVSINARYYADTPVTDASAGPLFNTWEQPRFDWVLPSDFAGLDVAVVGTGPAGLYTADLLLMHTASRVTLIDRLPMAGGLIRYGVAPDHPATKHVAQTFLRLYRHPRVTMALDVEVGTAVSVEELAKHFDAVVYAVGASAGRRLDVPGAELAGVWTAPQFVSWYNAHPDMAADLVSWSGDRAVVVGTGNVALDVARILTSDPATLATTDIADHALARLRTTPLREVVVLGRRGPADAAYTEPELLALTQLPGTALVVDADRRTLDEIRDDDTWRGAVLRQAMHNVDPDAPRRIVLTFHREITRIDGQERVSSVTLNDGTVVPTALVVTSIGYRGQAMRGLPFDPQTGTTPNHHGRIDGVPGAYAVGWFKRGSSGGIGDNRFDAEETVRTLLDDAVGKRLPRRSGSPRRFLRSQPTALNAKALLRILDRERAAGVQTGRPAAKFATRSELRRAASS